jgi:hypothetical protein
VGLQKKGDLVKPVFFQVQGEWDEGKLDCRFVFHKETIDKDEIHVKPDWDSTWLEMSIGTDVIWNCLPFDENRDYFYFCNKEKI